MRIYYFLYGWGALQRVLGRSLLCIFQPFSMGGVRMKARYQNVPALTLYTVLFLIFVVRAFFGVDWTDESYYAASAYRIVLGDPVFDGSWDIHQLAGILEAPLLWMYVKLTGGGYGGMPFIHAYGMHSPFCLRDHRAVSLPFQAY